ncbi:MAG: hypothetical protein HY053_08400, partial [Proteobacteria bacterium]|nr:hypothetical protein [Pseudomonadota bacterium]
MTRFFSLLTVFLFTAGFAHAATSKEDLARIQNQLSAKQQQAQRLEQKAGKTEDELDTLRARLVAATREEKESEDRLLDLQAKLDQLQKQEEAQRQALSEQQSKLSGVLAAMMRLSRMPPEVLMLRPEAPVDNLRSAILLRRALPYYAGKAQDLSSNLDRLRETRASIMEKRQDLIEAQKTFGVREERLNALLSERQAWLKATAGQRAEITRQIEVLSLEAKNAKELMSRVASSSLKLPGKKF